MSEEKLTDVKMFSELFTSFSHRVINHELVPSNINALDGDL